MGRRALIADVSGGRVRGRPRLGWMDGVKMALGSRGMTVEAARQCAKDSKEWRARVHVKEWRARVPLFSHGPAFFRTALQRSGGFST